MPTIHLKKKKKPCWLWSLIEVLSPTVIFLCRYRAINISRCCYWLVSILRVGIALLLEDLILEPMQRLLPCMVTISRTRRPLVPHKEWWDAPQPHIEFDIVDREHQRFNENHTWQAQAKWVSWDMLIFKPWPFLGLT